MDQPGPDSGTRSSGLVTLTRTDNGIGYVEPGQMRGTGEVRQPPEPPGVPEGWVTAPPDFVGVGAMRSGTSWWWFQMTSHPKFATEPLRKEVHFFDRFQTVETIDPDEYNQHFPRPEGKISGEWTPRYICDFWVPPMLRRLAPEAKILVLYRDPFERFISALGYLQKAGSPGIVRQQFNRSMYDQQVLTLLEYFPPEQVLVLQYEQCRADPAGQMKRTLEFLGLDPGEWTAPAALETRVNASVTAKPEFDPDTRSAMMTAFRAGCVSLFERCPDLDPALWPTMTASAI
jgi:sulfotransferase family protein